MPECAMHVARAQLAGRGRLLTVASCVLGGASARLERCARNKRHIHRGARGGRGEETGVVVKFARVLCACSPLCLCVSLVIGRCSGVICHLQGVICHVAGVICHLQGVICHVAGVICHLEGVICHLQGVICHVAGVICHLQGVICHVAGVICDRSRVIGPWGEGTGHRALGIGGRHRVIPARVRSDGLPSRSDGR